MKRLVLLGVALLMLAGIVTPMPAGAGIEEIADAPIRYVPRPAGVEKKMNYWFGPFTIPPGADLNRVTIDLPAHNGFYTAVAPDLVNAATMEGLSNQDMHIHHAHWLRVATGESYEYYTRVDSPLGAGGLSWVFGTGEEKTQGTLIDRDLADPHPWRYGIFIEKNQPQALIYMLHNKTIQTVNVYVVLRVTFVYGTRDEIKAASDCGVLLEGETCAAGTDFHPLVGKLWGTTFDVPRQPDGDGTYVHPVDIPAGWPRRTTDHLGRYYVANANTAGTVIAGAGHLHPSGKEVVIANLGPAGSGCEADVDGDGFPGVTLFRSEKLDRVAGASPHSEDYQMAATKFGFRAPIRVGDRISQFGVYANRHVAAYEAMAFTGLYTDPLQQPGPRTGNCLEDLRSVDLQGGDPLRGVLNHAWERPEPDPLCGANLETGEWITVDGEPVAACDRPWLDKGPGVETDTIHIAGFVYVPGDMGVTGPLGAPPRVRKGTQLRLVNEDTAMAGVRHTFTSCRFPCNGTYVANYPLPDGDFDTGKLGNLDYIDGGITGDDTVPVYELDTNRLNAGTYTYYCRIHPWMRGAFEVVA